MVQASQSNSRYHGPAASLADGWTLERITRPSRLAGANGMTTGKDGRLYVALCAGSQIVAIDPDSAAIQTISGIGGDVVGPDDLVFDDEGNLYITEITENRVRMLTPGGSSKVIAGDVRVANPIAFHQGRVLTGELTFGGRILELDRNGGAPRVIAENLPMVNAFEVGPDGKLYFPAQGANEIWRVSLDGGEPEVVAKDLGGPDAVKFDAQGFIVSTQVVTGDVLRIDPRTGAREVLANVGAGLDNLAFVGDRIFVSHIAGSVHEVLGGGKVRALAEKGLQWPMGLAVQDGELFIADGAFTYTLAPGGEPQVAGMLFTPAFPGFTRGVTPAGTAGEWIVTTANGDVVQWAPGRQESKPLASGYDRLMGVARGADGCVVFAEGPTGRVLAIDGGNVSEIATGLDRPSGVAIGSDGTAYVAEDGAGRVVRIVGGHVETVIDGLMDPHGLAFANGKLFVLDIGAKELIQVDPAIGTRLTIAAHLPVGAPHGVVPKPLGGVGDMCGPMISFTGLAAAPDGTIYVAGDGEGSVLAVRPA